MSAIHIACPNGYTTKMIPTMRTYLSPLRLFLLVIWLILISLLVKRELLVTTIAPSESLILEQAETEEYLSIFFREEKIGVGVYRYIKDEVGWKMEQEASMDLNIGNKIHPIKMSVTAQLTETGLLQSFRFSFLSPFYKMEGDGTVTNNDITYHLFTSSSTITDTVHFPSPPIIPSSRRNYLLNTDIQPGDKVSIPWFDPITLSGRESILEYRGRESIVINGRVERLHHFIETTAGIRTNSWLNDAGKLIKEESPAGFVFLREPKFKALAANSHKNQSPDLLAAVAVTPQSPLVKNNQKMRYRLTLPENEKFDLDGGRQHFDGQILTIYNETDQTEEILKCSETISDKALASTPYVQADSPKIEKLAEKIVAGANNENEKVRRLALWVYKNLEKRPVLGLPDALSTLDSKRGDCNEHASLFAALARAARVPTLMVAGVTFTRGAFYYHAWNEVCTEGRWLSVDTTINEIPADLTHLRFVRGEFQEQMQIGSLLGTLEIEPLPLQTSQLPETSQ